MKLLYHSSPMCLAVVFIALATLAKAPDVQNGTGTRFFSDQQSIRGKQEYNDNCSKCHTLDGNAAIPDLGSRKYDEWGYALLERPLSLAGPNFIAQWYSVADLYSKISTTMPGDNVHGLNSATYLDITAYLLKVNGFPPGDKDLNPDATEMKRMALSKRDTSSVRRSAVADAYAGAYYTSEQAKRGQAYFIGACGMCHRTDASGPRSLVHLAEHRQNVGNLFNFVRTAMPAYNAGSLSTEEYVDIVAYLLRVEESATGCRRSLAVSAVSSFVPV